MSGNATNVPAMLAGSEVNIAAQGIQLLIAILIVISNGLVFIIILKARLWQAKQNAFIFIIVTFDLMRGIVAISTASYLLTLSPDQEMTPSGPEVIPPGAEVTPTGPEVTRSRGVMACRVLGFFTIWTTVSSMAAVSTLFYDRLAYVRSPATYVDRLKTPLVVILLTYAVLFGLLFAFFPILGWSAYLYVPELAACSLNWADHGGFAPFLLAMAMAVNMAMTILAYIRTALEIQRRVKVIKVYTKQRVRATLWPMRMRQNTYEGRYTEMDVAFLKTWKTLTVILAFYCLSWFSLLGLFAELTLHPPGGAVPRTPAIYSALTCVSLLTSLANPVAYGLYNKRYRRALVSILTCGTREETEIQKIFQNGQPLSMFNSGSSYSVESTTISNGSGATNGRTSVTSPELVSVSIPKAVWQ